jgi:hypothetical protein
MELQSSDNRKHMKLNFQQKFHVTVLSAFVVAAVAASLFSQKPGHAGSDTYVNPITKTDSTFAVSIPEP